MKQRLSLNCPICKLHMQDETHYFKHLEEKHNQVIGEDQELKENTEGKELLMESCGVEIF